MFSDKQDGSSSLAFLKPANDILIDLLREFLKIEQHEHGRADALNFFDQRAVNVAQHNYRFRLRNLLMRRRSPKKQSIGTRALNGSPGKSTVREACAHLRAGARTQEKLRRGRISCYASRNLNVEFR